MVGKPASAAHAAGEPEGFYFDGKVYLLASQLKTPNDVARVLAHEVVGHHGLRGAFGRELDTVLNQIATMRRAEVDAKVAEYGLDAGSRVDRLKAAEEVLAEMAQSQPQLHFVQRAIAAIRNWLRQNVPGFRSLALTDAEVVRSFIEPARRYVQRGRAAAAQDGAPAFSLGSSTDAEKARILQGEPVAVLPGGQAPRGYALLRVWVSKLFRDAGGKAVSPHLGEVLLDERAVRDSIAHNMSRHKAEAFAAVPTVIKNGVVILQTRHSRDGESFFVSAPVRIADVDDIVTVLVRRDPNTQRMYLHSVATKESLLSRRVSGTDTSAGVERSGSSESGDDAMVPHRPQKESLLKPSDSEAGAAKAA